MPLPAAHSLAAGALYLGFDAGGDRRGWKRLLLAVVIANAADLDLLPGLLVGEPSRYHQGPSHSLGISLAVALLAAAVAAGGRRWPLRAPWAGRPVLGTALLVGLLWASHVLLDALTEDVRPPVGVPLLWPLEGGAVQLWPWFPRVERLAGRGDAWAFVTSLLDRHNLWALAAEVATLGPVVVAVAWWRRHGAGGTGR